MSRAPNGLVGTALRRIEDFLLEPAEPADAPGDRAPSRATGPRPVIAVVGLGRRCGATVVARALAAELAARDPGGAGAVASASSGGGVPLATSAARRLAESLADVPGASTTAVGRLCLVDGADDGALAECARHFAPLVLDRGAIEVEAGRIPADRFVLVTSPRIERALAAAAAACLRRSGIEPLVVTNMVRPGAAAAGTEVGVELPYSRAGAQLALGGRQARGELGRAVAALADLCEAPA
ncbi:MAG TPA: hypothetical protein VHG69_13460 [Thermoleophilaceae bacterium]|nr:hypothetical protein [Thermoleophilaceae bacterium]